MLRTVFYTILGYLSGSILYAQLFGRLLTNRDIAGSSPDHNPGTFNAFRHGGFWCGSLTLLCDLFKGFLPVYAYVDGDLARLGVELAFVLAAPVFGHILPLFYGFKGGKGIAVSFGCLLGLLPEYRPVLVLAFFFLFFSLVLKITPNYHRTLVTYFLSVIGMDLLIPIRSVAIGFTLVAGLIMLKLFLSPEDKEKCKVTALWKR